MNRDIDALADRIGDDGDCWPWLGAVDPSGYGRVSWRGRMAYAHRLVYHLLADPTFVVYGGWHGPTLDHLCCNKACVRPSHLEVVSRGENVRRHYARKAATA